MFKPIKKSPPECHYGITLPIEKENTFAIEKNPVT